jgi:hypothetical protein
VKAKQLLLGNHSSSRRHTPSAAPGRSETIGSINSFEQPRFMIHGRLPHSVQYRSSVIVRDERVYHRVDAIFDRGETSFRAVSIHVPHGSSARNENQAVQSGMRLKCSLRTFANRGCAFARSHISKPTYMKGPPAADNITRVFLSDKMSLSRPLLGHE